METIPSGAGRRIKKVLLTITIITVQHPIQSQLALIHSRQGIRQALPNSLSSRKASLRSSYPFRFVAISANRLGSALPARPCADASRAIASPART